jgi:hypothetical protein
MDAAQSPSFDFGSGLRENSNLKSLVVPCGESTMKSCRNARMMNFLLKPLISAVLLGSLCFAGSVLSVACAWSSPVFVSRA